MTRSNRLPVVIGLALIGFSGLSASQEKSPPEKNPPEQPGIAADPLPNHALKRLGTNRLRHGDRIMCLAYSPNGRILAAGSFNDSIRLWDTETGKQLVEIPERYVSAIAVVPLEGGSVVATAGFLKTIRFWETETGKEVPRLKLDGHATGVRALAFSPDASILASASGSLAYGSQDGRVILWDFLTGKIKHELKGHLDEINAITFTHDGSALATASSDRTVRVWNRANGTIIRTLDGRCAVAAAVFYGEGKTLASAGDDNLIRLWDVASGKLLNTLKGHTGAVVSLAVTSDGKTLISGAHDKSIRIWDLATGTATKIIPRELGDSDALALTKDGKFVACGGINNTIRIFEIATGKERLLGGGHQAGIHSVALSKDGKWLASGSTTGEIRLWDTTLGKEVRKWSSPSAGDIVLAFAPDGEHIVSASGADAIRFWDPRTGEEKLQLATPKGDPVLSLTFSPDGSKLAAGRRGKEVDIWDWKAKSTLHQLKYPGPVYAVAFSQDGSTLAIGGGPKISLFEVASGKEISSFDSKEGPPASLPEVISLAFSPDGKSIAVGCHGDGAIRLINTTTGKEIRAMEGHLNGPYALAFSADGNVLASASFDRSVRLWEAFSGTPIAVLQGHQGPVYTVAFTGNGRGVYSGSADTSIYLWDATGMSKDGTLPVLELQPQDYQSSWGELAWEDAARGHQAVWRMVASPKEGVPFLAKQLYLVDPKKVDQLFLDLNAPEFKVRDTATKEIERYGRWMEGRLKDVLKDPPTLEVQRRVEKLLAKLDVPGSLSLNQERLRVRRVMMVLEQLGTKEAVDVLGRMAQGLPELDLQQAAQASLDRLATRKTRS